MKKQRPPQTVFENIRPLPPHIQDATTIAMCKLYIELVRIDHERSQK